VWRSGGALGARAQVPPVAQKGRCAPARRSPRGCPAGCLGQPGLSALLAQKKKQREISEQDGAKMRTRSAAAEGRERGEQQADAGYSELR